MRSLSFPGTSTGYISRTLGTATDSHKFTYSIWMKRSTVSTAQSFIVGDSSHADGSYGVVAFDSSNALIFTGWTTTYRKPTATYGDTANWHHFVLAVDTTLATANNRIRVYWDGSEVTSFTTLNNPGQNTNIGFNMAANHLIGRDPVNGSQLFIGKMAQIWFVDGLQLDPSAFTTTVGGVLVPKQYAGALGNNGFFLSFFDASATANLGFDDGLGGEGSAAGSNDWTVQAGLTTANSSTDTPTLGITPSSLASSSWVNFFPPVGVTPLPSNLTVGSPSIGAPAGAVVPGPLVSIGSQYTAQGTSTTVTLTTTAAIIAGDLALVGVLLGNGSSSSPVVSNVSDGLNTYVQAATNNGGSPNGQRIALWYCKNAQARPSGTTITVTYGTAPAGGATLITAARAPNMDIGTVVDKTAVQAGSSTNPTAATGTMVAAPELVVSLIGATHSSAITYTESAGFSTAVNNNPANGYVSVMSYSSAMSIASVTYAPTLSAASQGELLVLVSFKQIVKAVDLPVSSLGASGINPAYSQRLTPASIATASWDYFHPLIGSQIGARDLVVGSPSIPAGVLHQKEILIPVNLVVRKLQIGAPVLGRIAPPPIFMGADRHMRRADDDYAAALASLLPKGDAWDPADDGESLMSDVVLAWAKSFRYVDGRYADLLERESDPRRTIEMLDTWERNFGLPDLCLAEPLTIGDRQIALVTRMTLLGAQSRAFFIDLAASIGYTIRITEYSPFVAGISECGDTSDEWGDPRWQLGSEDMRFYWTVHVTTARLTWWRVDAAQVGIDHMLEIGLATDLECLLRRYKPAHTEIEFDYGGLTSSGNPFEGTP
jgi:uncharacterized protein YmfQ (DUF2313 family)